MDFKKLIKLITNTHETLQNSVASAINKFLTIRNWLIGYYIVEYEQSGKDRAQYGSSLLKELEYKLNKTDIKGLTERRFRDYRHFYLYYTQIRQSLTAVFESLGIQQLLISIKDLFNSFNHVNAGQLNTYLNYYKQEIKESDDNPPVGILLVTDKDDALVQYAMADMDENLFVKKYLLQLPSKKVLEKYIKNELERLK